MNKDVIFTVVVAGYEFDEIAFPCSNLGVCTFDKQPGYCYEGEEEEDEKDSEWNITCNMHKDYTLFTIRDFETILTIFQKTTLLQRDTTLDFMYNILKYINSILYTGEDDETRKLIGLKKRFQMLAAGMSVRMDYERGDDNMPMQFFENF